MGSPPPTRGTHVFIVIAASSAGITPAYAGNTSNTMKEIVTLWDHPRLRGEHTGLSYPRSSSLGSPPPTRGTLMRTAFNDKTLGITPAYAGNTAYRGILTRATRDHPRLRGEHVDGLPVMSIVGGSPPPTRGTLNLSEYKCIGFRITPAYAGNT